MGREGCGEGGGLAGGNGDGEGDSGEDKFAAVAAGGIDGDGGAAGDEAGAEGGAGSDVDVAEGEGGGRDGQGSGGGSGAGERDGERGVGCGGDDGQAAAGCAGGGRGKGCGESHALIGVEIEGESQAADGESGATRSSGGDSEGGSAGVGGGLGQVCAVADLDAAEGKAGGTGDKLTGNCSYAREKNGDRVRVASSEGSGIFKRDASRKAVAGLRREGCGQARALACWLTRLDFAGTSGRAGARCRSRLDRRGYLRAPENQEYHRGRPIRRRHSLLPQ